MESSGQPGAAFLAEDNSLYVELTHNTLDVLDLTFSRVRDPACGAISTFLGVTRDNFNGKRVSRLEYDAYVPMALEQLKAIGLGLLKKENAGIRKVVISHRLGVVPVTEPSVVIAVASEHRQTGLAAVAEAIDVLKAKVPIWKKEFFVSDDAATGSEGDQPSESSKADPATKEAENGGEEFLWKRNPEWSTSKGGKV
jgi:molybdopterin synthase catalytic subunit